MNDPVYDVALDVRNRILQMEAHNKTLPQVDIPVKHTFSGGMYAREITIPAGVEITGSIHLTQHMNIIYGNVLVVTEEGATHYEGAHTIASPPGTKRAMHALGETVWVTVIKTDLTDVAEIERLCVTTDPSDPRLEGIRKTFLEI